MRLWPAGQWESLDWQCLEEFSGSECQDWKGPWALSGSPPRSQPPSLHMVKKGPAQGHVLSEWQCQALALPKPVLSLHGDAVLK